MILRPFDLTNSNKFHPLEVVDRASETQVGEITISERGARRVGGRRL